MSSTAIPSNLFAQFVEQGIKKGLIQDVTRTLDGEYYIDFEYLKASVSSQIETHSKDVFVTERDNFLMAIFFIEKINVEQLSYALAVEQFHIEKAIEGLLLENDKNWTVLDDLVLTQ
jgi:hypothetical protein